MSLDKFKNLSNEGYQIVNLILQGGSSLHKGLITYEQSEIPIQLEVREALFCRQLAPLSFEILAELNLIDAKVLQLSQRNLKYRLPKLDIEFWNLSVILHGLAQTDDFTKASTITLFIQKPLCEDTMTRLLWERCAHIENIRFMVEPVPNIDSMSKLMSFY